jgi:hypothetical protein
LVARTIPKNYRNVTGRLASSKNQRLVGFESTLEKDFYLLLEFDSDVASYKEQPVTISYNAFGQQHHYTPDVLVHYQPSADVIPALCEVKYRTDLRDNWADYRLKFKAARRYARRRGWRLRLITEREIRTPRLGNARFLRHYRDQVADIQDQALVLSTLQQRQKMTPEALISACSHDPVRQASLIPVLWHLIAIRQIAVDLGVPVTMHSPVWFLAEEPEPPCRSC